MKKNYLNRLIANLTMQSESKANSLQIRRLFAAGFKTIKKGKANFIDTINQINEIEKRINEETASWIEPENLEEGGGFDTMDLRHWLRLAELSNIPVIDAKVILSLSEAEYETITKKIQIPEFVSNAFTKRLNGSMKDDSNHNTEENINPENIQEKLFSAMDDTPSNWMVRSHLCGGNMLKAMAGIGTIDTPDELFNVDDNVSVGAGHVLVGNRRMIDATDNRIMKTFVSGHKPEIHFLARPWMKAARYGECEDPHRHGSVFAGKGSWPQEWRVFIENNKIIGVSSYYPWIGEVTSENAYKALEAVEKAQVILDKMIELNCYTKHMDTELSRISKHFHYVNDKFPLDTISCTLDFMETEELGMALLEGGPAHTPFSGAHPCGFCGGSFDRKMGCTIDGVALKLPDDVILADIDTWGNSQLNEKCILSWDEARELAREYNQKQEMTL